ncbi:NADP-dependent oxidoreductase [Microbulbifer sp. Q7]|uniref:NADP-dependent oxidoreductase n=1 Tax=Microbulbifer sp. Q7 TaxID=1785091 RepID=UPI000832A5FD|nr:NADP-dependent oxidoreductase [Microbulbifer sp. Q7]
MNTLTNQRWIYTTRPTAEVDTSHYRLDRTPLDTELGSGEVLIENHYISVDPYMRIQQAARPNWEEPHPLNTVQRGAVVGRVLASRDSTLAEGDWVSAYTGWERYSRVHGSQAARLDPDRAPVTTALGVLGMPGRTAWFGLMDAGRPRPGETLSVSGAAGAVGSLVVQFGKKAGCRVIAFAGSDEKCAWLTDELGADQAINYRHFADARALDEYFQSEGIRADIYFDNVGGIITDAVIPNINRRARIVICGQISQYSGNLDEVASGPRFLHHMLYQRAQIQGILARDFNHRMDEMLAVVAPWVSKGEIQFRETVVEGFEQLPTALNGLFHGHNTGKMIVKIK